MDDHHWLVRTQPVLDDQCVQHSDSLYRNRLRALLGVDELVGAVADTLLAHNLLDSTYILCFFLSFWCGGGGPYFRSTVVLTRMRLFP